MDYSDPDKIKTVLEILGINTKPRKGAETEPSCTVNQTISTNDEATLVALEILEERIDVAIEVSSLIHQTATAEQSDRGQALHS